MYKHCFLPLLLVSVMKCCVKMYCYLPHNPYQCCQLGGFPAQLGYFLLWQVTLFWASFIKVHAFFLNDFLSQRKIVFNTLRAGLIQAVRLIRTWLCAGISPLLYALQTW